MDVSQELNEIFKALAIAQGRYRNPEKNIDSEDGYKTAPLSKFFECVKRANKDNGLAFIQTVSASGSDITVSTLLTHSSGQWIKSDPFTVTYEKNTPEERGLAIYNAKKNSFCAFFGITGKNEVEEKLTSAETLAKGGLFDSAAERKEAKQNMLDDLKMVSSQGDLDEFKSMHQENIDKMVAEDATYVSDVLREMKVLKQGFDKDKEILNGKI